MNNIQEAIPEPVDNIEDAEIVVDLSGGRLLVKSLRERIEQLTAEIKDRKEKLADCVALVDEFEQGEEKLQAKLKAKDEAIKSLRYEIRIIGKCKIHCKSCNKRIEENEKALKGEDKENENKI